MPTQVFVALFMQIRIDCDIVGFAVLNSLQKVTERDFWFRVTPGRTPAAAPKTPASGSAPKTFR
jgi:hypothetical protein